MSTRKPEKDVHFISPDGSKTLCAEFIQGWGGHSKRYVYKEKSIFYFVNNLADGMMEGPERAGWYDNETCYFGWDLRWVDENSVDVEKSIVSITDSNTFILDENDLDEEEQTDEEEETFAVLFVDMQKNFKVFDLPKFSQKSSNLYPKSKVYEMCQIILMLKEEKHIPKDVGKSIAIFWIESVCRKEVGRLGEAD
jgi:hypothetical protein